MFPQRRTKAERSLDELNAVRRRLLNGQGVTSRAEGRRKLAQVEAKIVLARRNVDDMREGRR